MPRPKTLWLIDPSIRASEPQGIRTSIGDWPGPTRVFRPALDPEHGPGAADGYSCDAVIVLGSGASAIDTFPWLLELGNWLAPILSGEVDLPLLGICFGHQLIGHCAGAEVGFVSPDRTKILGVRTTHIESCRLRPGSHDLCVIASHREELKTVPRGYQLVGWRSDSPIDVIQHETRPIFSFQFHPEARGEFLARRGLDAPACDERVSADCDQLLGAFRALALGR